MSENKKYEKWITSLEIKYSKARLDSVLKANAEMITLFFELGKEISYSPFKESDGYNF